MGNSKNGLLVSLLATGAVLGSYSVASAQTSTSFAFDAPSGTTPSPNFNFSSNAADGSGTLSLVSSSEPIYFEYRVNNGYGPRLQQIAATLTLTATAAAGSSITSTTDAQGNTTVTQVFSSVTFKYTAVTPQGGFSNLLTGTFSSAQGASLTLTGGGGSASFNVNDTGSSLSDYSSDFLSFGTSTAQNFSFAFSAVNDSDGTAGLQTRTTNGVTSVKPFTSDGLGTFAANPVPTSYNPTPATPGEVSLMIGAGMGILQFGRSRFRVVRSKKTALASGK